MSSTSGTSFAAWAVHRPFANVSAHGDRIDEILLIGHSMGGLVVRSACEQAGLEQRT